MTDDYSINSGRRLRVLVVEDELLIADMLQHMLEDLGCEVSSLVGSVDDALKAIQSLQLDAAIVDLVLKGETAYPIARALKTKGIPFGFASGSDQEVLTGDWAGCPFTSKPYTKDEVEALLLLLHKEDEQLSSVPERRDHGRPSARTVVDWLTRN